LLLVLLTACSAPNLELGTHHINPVIPGDCPDPGVLRDGSQYVLTCTSGNASDAFPIYTSSDLVRWSRVSHVFPAGNRPTWATGDFWAPEIHKIGASYIAYFTARDTRGMLSIGAAVGASATGPFVDLGAPLLQDSAMGLIDASAFTAANGTPYLLWKDDGNAIGQRTNIYAQQLRSDGLALVGSPTTLISNDEPWEGAVTEAPFMVERNGMFYLFYSGNSYADATYAVGVARGPSPLGPMTKLGTPILSSAGAWAGPGHCAVVETFGGDTAVVYHAWPNDCINGPRCGRATLLDFAHWGADGWPRMAAARAPRSAAIGAKVATEN
jgi:beta-xylosidase